MVLNVPVPRESFVSRLLDALQFRQNYIDKHEESTKEIRNFKWIVKTDSEEISVECGLGSEVERQLEEVPSGEMTLYRWRDFGKLLNLEVCVGRMKYDGLVRQGMKTSGIGEPSNRDVVFLQHAYGFIRKTMMKSKCGDMFWINSRVENDIIRAMGSDVCRLDYF